MSYSTSHLLNTADDVDEAAQFVLGLLGTEAKEAGNKYAAHITLARRHRLPPALIRALGQPSRRPKTIAHKWWCRIRDAYLGSLRRQLAGLEAEIRRVEAMGPSSRPVQDLLSETEALASRIRALL